MVLVRTSEQRPENQDERMIEPVLVQSDTVQPSAYPRQILRVRVSVVSGSPNT